MAKCERYAPLVLLARVKSIGLANLWLINNLFYVFLLKIGTFEVTSQYFAYFISISSLVFENDKWTFWGCFGHFNMSHHLKIQVHCLSITQCYQQNHTCFAIANKQTFIYYYMLPFSSNQTVNK